MRTQWSSSFQRFSMMACKFHTTFCCFDASALQSLCSVGNVQQSFLRDVLLWSAVFPMHGWDKLAGCQACCLWRGHQGHGCGEEDWVIWITFWKDPGTHHYHWLWPNFMKRLCSSLVMHDCDSAFALKGLVSEEGSSLQLLLEPSQMLVMLRDRERFLSWSSWILMIHSDCTA